jgi:hypothetical protein
MKQEIQKIKDLVNKISAVVIKPNRDTFAINTYICIKSISPEVKQLQDEVSNLEKLYNSINPQESTSEQKDSPSKDNVNHPSHYQGSKYECIDVMLDVFGKEKVSAFCELNAFKYQWRANSKGTDIQDKKKAIWYNQKYIELNKKES